MITISRQHRFPNLPASGDKDAILRSFADTLSSLKRGADPNRIDDTGSSLMKRTFEEFAEGKYNDYLDKFFPVVDELLLSGGNPNILFEEIRIAGNKYANLAYWQIPYMIWKCNSEENSHVEQIFERMLEDRRINVGSTFTERSLGDYGLFSRLDNRLFSSRNKDSKLTDSKEGRSSLDYSVDPYYLEHTTLAHYAAVHGDFTTLEKLIERESNLLTAECCITSGRETLTGGAVYKRRDLSCLYSFFNFLNAKDRLPLEDRCTNERNELFEFFRTTTDRTIYREKSIVLTNFDGATLLHLAARCNNKILCGFLIGRCPELRNAEDCLGNTPLKYYKYTCLNAENVRTDPQMEKYLKQVDLIGKYHLPQTSITISYLGYTVVYDPRLKAPSYVYEMLTPDSLIRNAKRSPSFYVDDNIPALNRVMSNDFTRSGHERGHARPAADAVRSEEEMKLTFLYTNIMAMNPALNKGYWKQLENRVREYVSQYHCVEVFTGPVYSSKMDVVRMADFGRNEIPVPTGFFKVLYLTKGKVTKTECYLLPNRVIKEETSLDSFKEVRDLIQRRSGILFDERTKGYELKRC